MRKGLKFLELVKANNIYKIYKQQYKQHKQQYKQ